MTYPELGFPHADGYTWATVGAPGKRRGRNPFGFPRGSGLVCGGEYGTRTRGLRRDSQPSPAANVPNAPNTAGLSGVADSGAIQPSQPYLMVPNRPAAPVLQGVRVPAPAGATLRVVEGAKGHLLSVRTVADRLGVSTATVYGLVAKGRLPHVRVSNAVRVSPGDLDAFVASQRSTAVSGPRAARRKEPSDG